MKKFLISITIVLALGLGANAQIDMSDAFINDWETSNRLDMGGFSFVLPGTHGNIFDTNGTTTPLGSGLLILGALGAGYALKRKKSNHRALMALTLMMTLAFGQTAWAQTTTWTVGGTGNQFTITRSGDISREVTVSYRTVSLSALAGKHFIEATGTVTIPANQASSESISVTEMTPSDDSYNFQTTTNRTYRFEALDLGGFELAHRDRDIAYSTTYQHTDTYVNSSVTDLVYFNNNGTITSGSGNKYVDVTYSNTSDWTQIKDSGYSQLVRSTSTSDLYHNSNALRTYLNSRSNKMYATVYFTQKEEHDGYQYIQIYTGSSYDSGDDPNGGVNDPVNSIYKACFILSKKASVMSNAHYQFFPHRYNYHNKTEEQAANITHYEFDYDDSYLYEQKYKASSFQASTSGSLILSTTTNNIYVRFDAGGGGTDHDEWDFKNLKVRLALVDGTAPTVLNTSAIAVNAGKHCNGNDFYISVPFNEIVTIEGSTKKLFTSWGDAIYFAGSGSNVLTFKGTISAPVNTTLSITGKSGTIKDLAGNQFGGNFNKDFSATVEASYSYPIIYTLNGGTLYSNAPTSYTYDAATQFFGPYRIGYSFAGWTGSNGNTPEVPITIPIHSHGDKFYTANWTLRTYTITYYLNGGEPTGSYPENFTIETPTFTIAVPTKTGYTFNNWYYQIQDDNGVNYTGGHLQGDITVAQGSNGSRTYQANWNENMYCLHYDANATNGIPAIGTMEDHYCFYNEPKTLRANAFSRTGYTFAGWNTEPDGSGTAFTDQQVVYQLTDQPNVTITLYAQWNVIPWEGNGTSADDPYLIIYPSQLLKLADDVNNNHNYHQDEFFKLGNDIDMTGVAFSGIGNSSYMFKGTFDGDNKTISNLTINGDAYIGLFGNLCGNVHDLILSGASITGQRILAGIAGSIRLTTTISNCLVINSNFNLTSHYTNGGAIVGETPNDLSGVTFTQNYYRNCSVTLGNNTNTTNIGVGGTVGDMAGARSLHTLSLPEHVTASSDETKVIGDVTYYASNVTVTLAPEQGFTLTDVTVNGTAATPTGNGTWTFTMPAADATVSCGNSVTYIDANGNQQSCTNFTIIQSSNGEVTYGTEGEECWFVVNSDVTINGMLTLKGSSQNLILCDGASLNIFRENNNKAIQSMGSSSTFSIFGQTNGTGSINATNINLVPCIQVWGNLVINGGSVNASSGNDGIYASSVTINGGSVSATTSGSYTYGICTNGDITLGWRNLSDRIYANSYYIPYNNSIVVKAGQYLTNGTTVFSGNQGGGGALAGQTLQPCFSLTLPEHVVATSGVISQSNGLFALPGASVVLEAAEGYALGEGTWEFTMPANNYTVTGTVTAITYHIDYDLCGGTVATANPDTYTIESGAITLNNPSRTSFTFTGWNGTDLTEPTMSVTIPAGSTGDRSYGATWSPNIAQLWGTGDGSQNAPYIISSPEGLDLLATLVNEGNNYNNTCFELGDNIQYDNMVADNYTPIGFSVEQSFAGTFDGKGYTISGIRNTTELYTAHGLFGVSCGDIYNVVLEDVQFNIINSFVGCVVGWNIHGNVYNSLVIDAVSSISNPDGFIVGYNEMGIVDRNYYYNCTISNTSGQHNCGTLSGDATTNVVFDSYTNGIVYNNVLYAPYNAHVALILSYNGEVPAGYAPVFVLKDDYTTPFNSGSNLYFVNLEYDDVTITALLGKTNVPYLDEDGVEQTCPVAIEIASENGDSNVHYHGGWYVVNSNTNISKSIEFHDDAHLILGDNTGISAQGINGSGSLTVYAQSEGNASGVCQAPFNCGALTINGGKFIGNISVNKGDLVINSGLVVTSSISAQYVGTGSVVCNITLGWRSENDRISADSYTCDGSIKIKDGQYFTNGPELVYGTITDMSKLNGKTLNPFQSNVEYFDANGVQQYCTDFTVIESGTNTYSSSSEGSWYVVYNHVELYDIAFDGGDTHIILMDGCGLDLNKNSGTNPADHSLVVNGGELYIYGQTNGTGAIHGECIKNLHNNIIVYGGSLTMSKIIITGSNLYINGGSVTAGVGISAWRLRLGWSKTTDRIAVEDYSVHVMDIIDGKAFHDGNGHYYCGDLTDEQIEAMGGTTLIPFTNLEQQFAITYHTDGGSLPSGYPTYYTFNTTVELPVPTREDYAFIGWYNDAEFRHDRIALINAGTMAGDIDLYALWGPKYTDVRYVDEYGVSQIAHASVLYGGIDATYPGGVYTINVNVVVYRNLHFTGNTTLILPEDNALGVIDTLTPGTNNGVLSVDGNLTIYGQEDGQGEFYSESITTTGAIAIYGGCCHILTGITANNGDGNITLGWTGLLNTIESANYNGHVTAAKSFLAGTYSTQGYSILNAGEVTDHTVINGKVLNPYATMRTLSYRDENNEVHTVDANVLWGDETNLEGGIYTFMDDVTFDHGLSFNDNTTIIIPDNIEIEFKTDNNGFIDGAAINVTGNLAIYGQWDYGELEPMAKNGIIATGNITIANIYFYIDGNNSSSHLYSSNGNVLIVGKGYVSGIDAMNGQGTITIGYNSHKDEIMSKGYNGTVIIRDDQRFYFYIFSNIKQYISGTLTPAEAFIIKEKYIYPDFEPVALEVEGYGDGNGKWMFIASPVVGSITVNDVDNILGYQVWFNQYDFDLYRLNPNSAMWENFHQHNSEVNPFLLENGKGYLYAREEDKTLTFKGAYNMNDSQDVALEQGWNLVGNPFTTSAYINRSYYKMNAEGTDIEVVENTNHDVSIPACIGVVVKATGDNEKVTFTKAVPSSQAHDNGSLQMTLKKSEMRGEEMHDKAIVSFNAGTELGKYIFNESHAKLYIPQDGKDYAIAYSNRRGEMPLHFKANETGLYTIRFDGDMKGVKIIDKVEDEIINLGDDNEYTFIGSPADRKDRFMLVFSPSTGSQEDVFAYQSGSGVIVTGNGELQVYDIMGRKVLTQYINGVQTVPTSSMQIGVYIFKMNDKWQKIVIK